MTIEISEEFKSKFKKVWESPLIQAEAFLRDLIKSRRIKILNKYKGTWDGINEEKNSDDPLVQEYSLLIYYSRFIDYLVKERKYELNEPLNEFLPLGKKAQEWYDWIEKQEKEEAKVVK